MSKPIIPTGLANVDFGEDTGFEVATKPSLVSRHQSPSTKEPSTDPGKAPEALDEPSNEPTENSTPEPTPGLPDMAPQSVKPASRAAGGRSVRDLESDLESDLLSQLIPERRDAKSTKPLSLRLDPEIKEELRGLSRAYECSMTDIVIKSLKLGLPILKKGKNKK